MCVLVGDRVVADSRERRDLGGSNEMGKKGQQSHTLLTFFLRLTLPLAVPSAPKSSPCGA